MRSILAFAAALLFVSAAGADDAAPGDGHPVMQRIVDRADGGIAGPCLRALHDEYARIAAAETTEVQFIAKDMLDGSCRVVFLASGTESSVHIANEARSRALSEPGAAALADVHTHPLTNGAYFGGAQAYKGEIMFADEAAVASRRLDEDRYRKVLAAVRDGRIPGFNMSPPSTRDFLASGGKDDSGIVYIVLTSGGYWTYTVVDREGLQVKIDFLVEDANIFEAAWESPPPGSMPGRRERAQALLAETSKDPERSAFLKDWGTASLDLRAPYSDKALQLLDGGDDSAVRAEFAEKISQAKKFSELLSSIGVSATFTPF